jgi:hypothetical protein
MRSLGATPLNNFVTDGFRSSDSVFNLLTTGASLKSGSDVVRRYTRLTIKKANFSGIGFIHLQLPRQHPS